MHMLKLSVAAPFTYNSVALWTCGAGINILVTAVYLPCGHTIIFLFELQVPNGPTLVYIIFWFNPFTTAQRKRRPASYPGSHQISSISTEYEKF